MAKNKKATLPVNQSSGKTAPIAKISVVNYKWLPHLILFIYAFLIYSNCLSNKYAIDDTLVLTENKFTKKGTAGIGDLMTHDAFVGFLGEEGSKTVSGGRYRPLSTITLAVEYEITRKMRNDKRVTIDNKNIILGDETVDPYLNPALSHLINILLFAITCVLLYQLLLLLFNKSKEGPFYSTFAFLAALLFASHPVHTEAVANIKGRDEIMGLLFSLGCLYCSLKYIKNKNIIYVISGMILLLFGLFSKENVITFMAIIPLTFYFFTNASKKDYIIIIGLYLIPVATFLLLRNAYTVTGISKESNEILNNPFALASGFEDKYATIFYSFLLYLKVLLFPVTLTHDYYYNQIPYVKFISPEFIFSFLINASLLIYALINFKKRTLPSYAILFYFITLSIVSNILFTVGIIMNERFIYFSSVGFCILAAYLITALVSKYKLKQPLASFAITIVLVILYSAKTYSRNPAWESNFRLYLSDGKASPNSAKLNTAIGGDLIKFADQSDNSIDSLRRIGKLKIYFDLLTDNYNINQTDSVIRKDALRFSIQHLKKALDIYPTHHNAWLLLGNAEYTLNQNPATAIPIYENAAKYSSNGFYLPYFNSGLIYLKSNQPALAVTYFKKALEIKPDKVEILTNLAEAYNRSGITDSAIYSLNVALKLNPDDAGIYHRIGTIYARTLNKFPEAIENFKKAIELNPAIEIYYQDLSVAYGITKQFDLAISANEACLRINPSNVSAYYNMSLAYRSKGDTAKAEEYLARANQLQGGSR